MTLIIDSGSWTALELQQTQWSMAVSLFWEQDFLSIKELSLRAPWKSAKCVASLSITSVVPEPNYYYLAQDIALKRVCVVFLSVYRIKLMMIVYGKVPVQLFLKKHRNAEWLEASGFCWRMPQVRGEWLEAMRNHKRQVRVVNWETDISHLIYLLTRPLKTLTFN